MKEHILVILANRPEVTYNNGQNLKRIFHDRTL